MGESPAESDIAHWMRELKKRGVAERMNAVHGLMAVGPAATVALPDLRILANHRDTELRALALTAIARISTDPLEVAAALEKERHTRWWMR
jgi:hypothetical protein